jgi:hypothetical protein
MRRGITLALIIGVLAFGSQATFAQQKAKKKLKEKKATSNLVTGAQVEKKVATLTKEVNWLSSLEEAKKQAREEKKAIFWLHALGDLDGDT